MISRYAYSKAQDLLKSFPVLTITGPRQSGKTTLARSLFKDNPYYNLEEPDVRRYAIEDPRGFLNQNKDGVIIDEIQRAPELSSYIQGFVDDKNCNGLFILTGSEQFAITHTISQSLAGRSASVKLMPFDLMELSSAGLQSGSAQEQIFKGFYPRLYNGASPQIVQFYASYYENYVERDIRNLSNIENLHLFDKFVHLLAARVGQLFNASSLGNDVGVSQPTIEKWLSLLEAGFIIFRLQPFHANIGKRLIKTPKIYFYDTGLLCNLLGITESDAVFNHSLKGSLFENLIIADYLKRRYHSLLPPNIYFFRDRTGHEVDLIIEKDERVTPIEIKSAETYSSDFSKGLSFFQSIMGNKANKGHVLYAGTQAFSGDYPCIPWNKYIQRLI